MRSQDVEHRWLRLNRLLEPFHAKAAATARNLCRSADDGDDLYQEAMLRAFDKLHTLRDEARFRSWFFAVLLSVHRSRHRRSFWKRFLPLEIDGDSAPMGENGRVNEEEFLAARRAARALSRLPAEQREAIVLHSLEGFPLEEVAAMQGVSLSAVKSRVLRGRAKLKRHYRAMGIDRSPEPSSPAPPLRTGGGAPGSLMPAISSVANRQSRQGGPHE